MFLEFSIALCTGMVAATLLPPVRKAIPRPIEAGMWAALVVACFVGVLSITNPNARELTASAFWGVDRVINTLVGLLGAGVLSWLAEHRFAIATWVTFIFLADIVALAVLRSYRQRYGWQPRVRLGEWMELPRLAQAQQRVVAPYALDALNQRLAAATAVAGAAFLTSLVNFLIWMRDVLLPDQAQRLANVTAAGRIESRARLESLRDTASQLQFAARAMYTVAGAPALSGLAERATDAVRSAGDGQRAAAGFATGKVAEIRVLLNAQSIGWYGPVGPAPVVQGEEDEDEPGQTGRLAS
jgi:hypothetical protein